MSAKTLYRLSGLTLLIALPIQIVGWILHPTGESLPDLLSQFQVASHVIMFCSWLLAALGLPGLYARQAQRAGVLGLAGYVLVMFSAAYHFYLLLYEAYPAVLLAYTPATQTLIATGGALAHGAGALSPLDMLVVLAFPLFGIAMIRAKVLPALAGWLLIACVPASFAGMIVLPDQILSSAPGAVQPVAWLYYLLFAGFGWGGYALWTGKERVSDPVAHAGPQPAAV